MISVREEIEAARPYLEWLDKALSPAKGQGKTSLATKAATARAGQRQLLLLLPSERRLRELYGGGVTREGPPPAPSVSEEHPLQASYAEVLRRLMEVSRTAHGYGVVEASGLRKSSAGEAQAGGGKAVTVKHRSGRSSWTVG